MPGQDDTREFDHIVERLQADDPWFASRVEKVLHDDLGDADRDRAGREWAEREWALRKPRRKLRAGLFGGAALFAMILGGWTGLLLAMVITIWAVHLILLDHAEDE